MIGSVIIGLNLLSVWVNVARVDGPEVVSDAGFRRVLRATRRQYRKQAKIRVYFDVKTVKGYETGQYKADIRQLNNYLVLYREKYGEYVLDKKRPAMLVVPPLTDTAGNEYGGGAASLKCAVRQGGALGFASMGDTERQWDLAPTLFAHELGHQLHAFHTTEGLMHANALIFVKGSKLTDRPAMSRDTIRQVRNCLVGDTWYYQKAKTKG